jgi:hypothetical protein
LFLRAVTHEEINVLRSDEFNDNRKVTRIYLEQLNETLLCGRLGRCQEVKALEVGHRTHQTVNMVIDFSLIDSKRGDIARSDLLVRLDECKPLDFFRSKIIYHSNNQMLYNLGLRSLYLQVQRVMLPNFFRIWCVNTCK